jgi:predicted nucleic acid-binding protein
MAANTLVDAGFLVALINRRDSHHKWAAAQSVEHTLPWLTCEAVLSETFYILGSGGETGLTTMLRRGILLSTFVFGAEREAVLALMQKYSQIPMDFADACLVRMTETTPDPVLLSTNSDFRIYRRHSRNVIPCSFPD